MQMDTRIISDAEIYEITNEALNLILNRLPDECRNYRILMKVINQIETESEFLKFDISDEG